MSLLSEIVTLRILTVLVKIKTNTQQIQELLFRLSNIVLTCSTVVKFAYYTYVIIERHLIITRTP
jgi:hypothetical protein